MMEQAVVALVVGDDPVARARTIATLASQSVAVSVMGAGESLATSRASVVVMVTAGVELDHTACERLAWYLATHPVAAWVTGGSHACAMIAHDGFAASSPAGMAPLDALQQAYAMRVSEARRTLSDAFWSRARHTGGATPGLMLHALVLLQRNGGRGGWLDPILSRVASPLTTADGATTDASESVTASASARALASLHVIGIDPASLIEPRLALPSPIPLQALATSPSPSPSIPEPVPVTKVSGHRVLALLQGFPMGGYAAFNADMLPRLVARGHHVTTACLEWWRSDWRLEQVRAVAPDVHHVPSIVPFASIAAYVEHLIDSRQIDVVLMSHSFLGYRLLPHLRARFPHVAFVDYVHTEWFEQPMYGSYAAMSSRWSAELDAQVTTSQALARALIEGGAPRAQVQVAHIGIDPSVWSRAGIDREEIRTAFGASDDTTLLLFAGRVSPEKRPLLTLDALEALRAEGCDVRLVVAGEGPLLRAMQEAAEARGLEAFVSLLGEVDDHTLRQVYTAADVFFAPSEIEGVARTLYEAMAMGCVPVVSDVGGQRELVAEGTGSLVAPQPATVAPYLPALRRWCEPAARRAASDAGRAYIAQHFTSDQTVSAIERALSAACLRAQERARSGGTDASPRMPAWSAPMAEEVAVMGLEVARRHALAAATALMASRGR